MKDQVASYEEKLAQTQSIKEREISELKEDTQKTIEKLLENSEKEKEILKKELEIQMVSFHDANQSKTER